jgi:hypothetical protein
VSKPIEINTIYYNSNKSINMKEVKRFYPLKKLQCLKYLIFGLIFLIETSNLLFAQCTNIVVTNTCTAPNNVCAPTDFIRTCSTGWSPTHGTPNLIYVVPPIVPNSKRSGPFYYLNMVADNTGSEGAFYYFQFVAHQTYNVLIYGNITGSGLLNCYAANSLYQQQNSTCQAAVQVNNDNQLIGQSPNSFVSNFTFTARENFSQLWLYSSYGGGAHFNAAVTEVAICAVCNIGIPTGLSTSNNQTTLIWTSVPNAYSYNIMVSDTYQGTTYTDNFTSTTPSLNYCARASGDPVSYVVQGVCANGTSTGMISSPYTFTPTYTTLTAPSNLVFSFNGDINAPCLTWTAVPGANYVIVTKDLNTGSTGAISYTTNSISSYQLQMTPNGDTYQVTIYAVSGCNNSAPATITFVLPAPCNTPYVGNVEALGGGVANVAWQTVTGAASYNIKFAGTTTKLFSNYIPTGNPSNGINFSGIPAGSYTVSVQTNCTSGLVSAWGSYYSTVQINSNKKSASSITETIDSSGSNLNSVGGISRLYPNPANSQIIVYYNSSQQGNAEIQVLNNLGSKLMTKIIVLQKGQNSYTINTNNLANGIYVVRLVNKKDVFVQKLIIQK